MKEEGGGRSEPECQPDLYLYYTLCPKMNCAWRIRSFPIEDPENLGRAGVYVYNLSFCIAIIVLGGTARIRCVHISIVSNLIRQCRDPS